MRNYTDKYVSSGMLSKMNIMFESLVDYSTDKKEVVKQQNGVLYNDQLIGYYSKVSDEILSNMFENKELETINDDYFKQSENTYIPSMYDLKAQVLDNEETYKKCLQQTYLLFSSISIDDINKNFLMAYDDYSRSYISYNTSNIKYEDAQLLNTFYMIKQSLLNSEIKEIQKDFDVVKHNSEVLSELNNFVFEKEKMINEYQEKNNFVLEVIKEHKEIEKSKELDDIKDMSNIFENSKFENNIDM